MSRTKAQRAVARKLLKKPKGRLEPKSLDNAPDWMTRAYTNNRYVVMILDDIPTPMGGRGSRYMVQRHDDKPLTNHWREMQSIKNELCGKDAMGYEVYPKVSELEDVANIYWLWVENER